MLLRALEHHWSEVIQTNDDEYLIICPFHADERPSCSINLKKKLFNCHACGEAGSFAKLIAKASGSTEEYINYEIKRLKDFKEPNEELEKHHLKLLSDARRLAWLKKHRRWTLEAIRNLRLGYNGTRITIPIYSPLGLLLNVRLYKPGAKKNEPKCINIPGFGQASLFFCGLPSMEHKPWIICEGEPDAITGYSFGFPTCSSTAGAGKFVDSWASAFIEKAAYICYDADEAGERGAIRAAKIVARTAKSVLLIDLRPYLTRGGKDLTDYFLQGGTSESFQTILNEAKPFAAERSSDPAPASVEAQTPAIDVSLAESSEEKYYRKKVKIPVMISGKTLSPYIVPRKVVVTCPLPGAKMCAGCGLELASGKAELEFSDQDEELLELVETHKDFHVKIFKRKLGIPSKCGLVEPKVKEARNIEEAKVIPDIESCNGESEYVLRQIFYTSHGLQPNTSYIIQALVIPHPKTQQVTLLVNDAEPLEDSINQFELSEEVAEQLEVFSIERADESSEKVR